jgi:hypothetical protein
MFLEDNFVSDLRVSLPLVAKDDADDENFRVTASEAAYAVASIAEKAACRQQWITKIEKLRISLSNPVYCGLLDCLLHWPRLAILELCLIHVLEPSLPALCELLDQEKLKHLKIEALGSELHAKKRKEPAGVPELPLGPLFDALQRNTSLTMLDVIEYPMEGRTAYTLSPSRDRLLMVLEHNTSLTHAIGFDGACDHGKAQVKNAQLDYYLKLNRCNRKAARDPSTSLGGFLDLLSAVETRLDVSTDRVSVRYGLLQEGINKWAK